jgi:hypothetical protein
MWPVFLLLGRCRAGERQCHSDNDELPGWEHATILLRIWQYLIVIAIRCISHAMARAGSFSV